MAAIAEDETRYAALGWAIARWAEANLDERARARVARRRRREAARIARSVEDPLGPTPEASSLARIAGVPTPREARALAHRAAALLWGATANSVD
jgi:hypothetical protein